MTGCQPEEVRFEDNPIPPYEGVPTVVVDAYLTRVYIDLIGREPLPGELSEERAALRRRPVAGSPIRTGGPVMGADTDTAAYDRKLTDDLSGRFLDGAGEESMLEEIEFQRFSRCKTAWPAASPTLSSTTWPTGSNGPSLR